MSDEPEYREAMVNFGTIRFWEHERVICGAIFDGVLHIGIGLDNRSAFEDAVKHAYPDTKTVELAPQVTWSGMLDKGVKPEKRMKES
jgi:hypothetical protein